MLFRIIITSPSKKISSIRRLSLLKTEGYIGGEWTKGASGLSFQVKNPANGRVIAEVPDMTPEDAKTALSHASKAFQTWQNTTAKERAEILRNWHDLTVANSEELSKIITAESGKPLTEAKAEIVFGSSFLEWFSSISRHVEGEIVASPFPNKLILHSRQPLGVVSIITPWNFPYAMITRKVGALLAAGCTCVIRPAEDTPLTALALVKLAEESGIPPGVINIVTSDRNNAASIGKILCEDDSVACISFTGSTQTGKIIYNQASKGVKRVCLELGGNAPFIVFPNADMTLAMDQAMTAKFRNNGQACSCANRYLIHEQIYDNFVEGMKERMEKLKLGDGSCEDVTCGPLINKAQFTKVKNLVDDAVSKGAKVILGAKPASSLGSYFYEPTLLVNVTPDMRIYHEEIFGPVVTIIKIKDEAEALEIANCTRSGLASYVFTKDLAQAFRVSKKLEFGMVGINDSILNCPEAAFGGIKESGIGKEGSRHGVEEFTYIKYSLVSQLDR